MRAKNTPGLRSAYDKIRIRRSIEYPVAGVAVALRRDGDTLADLRVAFTGTNPRPVLLEGTAKLCGGTLDDRVFKGLDDLVRDQIMSMKTTFTPGHYRRRVAGVLARRLVVKLFDDEQKALEALLHIGNDLAFYVSSSLNLYRWNLSGRCARQFRADVDPARIFPRAGALLHVHPERFEQPLVGGIAGVEHDERLRLDQPVGVLPCRSRRLPARPRARRAPPRPRTATPTCRSP